MILIAAMTKDRVIGKGAALPWNIPDEYAQFLEQVRGHAIVMGRTSYEIFGPDLRADSPLIVVSRSVTRLPEALVCGSVEDAASRAGEFGTDRVFCAGGASIYRLAMPLATRMHLSFIKRSYDGDVAFPEFDDDTWKVERRRDHPAFEYREYARAAK